MTREERIRESLNDHLNESCEYFAFDRIVGVFLQGSQNYGLDYEGSDIDTKLLVTPSLDDICRNRKPISHTHVRANEEHIDFKDIRLYGETFRKQNLNFLEILFTPFEIVNPFYSPYWSRLVANREAIAHMNTVRCLKSMKGVALEKYHAMEHEYPTKVDIIRKYGYDGKQVHHLLRVEDFMIRYIRGESFEECMIPSKGIRQHLMDYKRQLIPLEEAREEAKAALARIDALVDWSQKDCEDEKVRELLDNYIVAIMKASIVSELH